MKTESRRFSNKFLLIIFILVYSTASYGQGRIDELGNKNTPKGHLSREEYRKKQDSIKANRIEPLVKLWQLEADGAYKVRHYRDTSDMDIQILYPNFRKSIANTFTGNVGSANQSSIFIHRDPIQEFLFLQPYEVYLKRPETHNFVDTRTPYTKLNYSTGGKNNRKEEILNVLLTRNINQNWNVGLTYNLISSDGQYQNQKHKVYDFTLFTSFEKGRYNLYGFINHNRIKLEENGGIADDAAIKADTTLKAENIEVRLFKTGASLHNYNYFLSHQYNIGEKRERVLFGDTTAVYPIKIVHTLHFDKSSKRYSESPEFNTYYTEFIYNNTTDISEETKYQNLKNSAQLVLNEGYFNWFKYGLRAEIQHEHITYNIPALVPVFPNSLELGQEESVQDNLAIEAGTYYSSTERTNWAASWKTYISGYKSGDTEVNAHYKRYFGKDSLKSHEIKLDLNIKNAKPSKLWNNYTSNHIIWNNDFENETNIKLGGYYNNDSWGLKAGGYWEAIKNYTYFNEYALPAQESDEIVVFTAFAEKDFQFWKMHFVPTLYWQDSSNENVLPLPKLSLYANTYFESELFQKAIRLRVGVDVRYNTKWYAPDYFPATGQFHLQKQKKLGGFPKADVYLVSRFKRASFFVKWEHLNQSFMDHEYFSALHYPITPSIIKYGIKWYFYD